MKIRTDMKRHQGFSLIELMIALTISMLLLLGLAVIYERNSSTRYEVERNSRQLENGRYALNLLAGDIRLAGYLSSFTNIPVPTVLPTSPCSTEIGTLQADFNVYLQGFDNGSGGLSCLPDYRGGDVIVVRRASACSAANPAETDCAPLTAGLPVSPGIRLQHRSGCLSVGNGFDQPDPKEGRLHEHGQHPPFLHPYLLCGEQQPSG